MNICKDCIHAEMCKWRDELEGRGCDFFDGEPCTDAVSREAVINEFEDMYKAAVKWRQDATEDIFKARAEATMATLVEQKMRVQKLPSVQPSRKGHWEECDYLSQIGKRLYRCSECGGVTREYNFCPNCGARMESEEQTE